MTKRRRVSNEVRKLRPYLQPDESAAASASAAGITDHGFLTGLLDDDHPQYLNTVRGDLRYMQVGATVEPDEHDIISFHTVTGSQYDIVGLTAANTLGLLTPASDISGGNTIAISDASGDLKLNNLWGTDRLSINAGDPAGLSTSTVRFTATETDDSTLSLVAAAGQTGNLLEFQSSAPSTILYVAADGTIRTSVFSASEAGPKGFRLSPDGTIECKDFTSRGTFYAASFVAGETHVVNGNMLFGTHLKLYQDTTILATDSSVNLHCENPITGAHKVFRVGENLRIYAWGTGPNTDSPLQTGLYAWEMQAAESRRSVQRGDIWLRVSSATWDTDHWYYTCQVIVCKYDITLLEGTVVYSYGVPVVLGEGEERPGRVGIFTEDPVGGNANVPYIQVFTIGDDPHDGDIYPHVHIGKLWSTAVGISKGEMGIAIGTDLSDPTEAYIKSSQFGVEVRGITQRSYNYNANEGGWVHTYELTAQGNLKIGSNVADDEKVTFEVNANSGDITLGSESTGQYIKYDASEDVLIVAADLSLVDFTGSIPIENVAGFNESLYLNSLMLWDGIGNIPARFRDELTTVGGVIVPQLYATSSYLGFVSETGFNAYIDGDGNMLFGESETGARIQYDASTGHFSGWSSGEDEQFRLDASTGKMLAGIVSGTAQVTLDEDGVQIAESTLGSAWLAPNKMSFGDYMYAVGYYSGGDRILRIASSPLDLGVDAAVRLIAEGGTTGSPNTASMYLTSNSGGAREFYLNVDDIEIAYDFPTALPSTAGSVTAYLPVTVNGTDYKIPLHALS